MNPIYSYDKVNVFYKNGIIHHARIDYKKRLDDNQSLKISDYVYRREIRKRLNDIVDYYRRMHVKDFNIKDIIVYRNYEDLTISEFEKEEELKKRRKDRDFYNSSLGTGIRQVKDTMYSLDVLLHMINLRMVAWITVGSILVGGAGYALCKQNGSKTGKINMATKSIETMMTDDNPRLDNYDIDTLLDYIDDVGSMDFDAYSNGRKVCEELLRLYRPNTNEGLIILNRFNTICGLKQNGRYSERELRRMCMYGTNLIMGGDDYGDIGTSMIYAMKFNDLELNGYEGYARTLQSSLGKNNLSLNRIMYSATKGESYNYKKLPPIIRYIILSRVEMAVERTKFEFEKDDRPLWWFKTLKETYSYEELIVKIRTEKADCREEIYAMYSFNTPTKR